MEKETSRELKTKDILTTGQIAKFCCVDPRTVHRWIRQKLLPSHELPITKFQRVQVKDFLNFLKEQGLPVPEALKKVAKYRILIVDDDPGMINAMRRILSSFQKEDYEFETACDGFAAGCAIQKFQPDLIVLDLKMPRMDGMEVCRQIRSNPDMQGIKILAVSGMISLGVSSEEDRRKIIKLGADDFLEKPFAEQVLKDRVLQLLFGKERGHE